MTRHEHFFADGSWHSAHGQTFDVVNPANEEAFATVVAAATQDVDAAARAAAAAADSWAATPIDERLALLDRVRETLLDRQEELAETITSEMGMPLAQSRSTQVGWCLGAIADVLAVAEEALADERVGLSSVDRVPAGVAACITPWNFPIQQVIGKVAEALAAGCPVVVKASELAPVSPLQLAACFEAAGCPRGVFNLISGGPSTGEALVSHPQVGVVSFTGSTQSGARVAQLAAGSLKRVSLELGGKCPSVLLDADPGIVEQATRATLADCFFNSGQVCTALSRFVVPEVALEQVSEIAESVLGAERVGDPIDPQTTLGPLVSARQRDHVRSLTSAADRAGVRSLQGGAVPDRGWFVAPAVYLDVPRTADLALQEVFGPILAVLTHQSDEQAIAIANDGDYGLSARVWAADAGRAADAARRIDAGQVGINDSPFDGLAPFGGFKRSGVGRAHGRYGVREFTQIRAVPAGVPVSASASVGNRSLIVADDSSHPIRTGG